MSFWRLATIVVADVTWSHDVRKRFGMEMPVVSEWKE